VSDRAETFFITKTLHPKKPGLDVIAREMIVSALEFALTHERIFLRAFVVMPDHWHALLALREPWTLPKFMHDMMSFVGSRTQLQCKRVGTQWQDGYYDTLVKTAKQFGFVADYIEENPVTRGLVESAEEWIQSSAHRTDLITDPWPCFYD
jgi:REP element-mobilizing transposase RayT